MNSNWFLIDYTSKKYLQGNFEFEFNVVLDTEFSEQKQRQFRELKVINSF